MKGTDTSVGLVFTLDGEKNVCGKAQIVSTDLNEVGSQLWRFEQVGEGRYMIYNMAGEGRALDIVYDATENTGRCILASEPSVTFNLVADGDYFHIVASQAAAGTDASEIYLHQGNSGYHFAVITTGSYYGTGQNSSFTFVPFKDYSVAISNDKTQTYYRLTNASAAYSGRSITLTQGENGATLTLAEGADGGTADAQWRMEAHPAGTGWLMINRAAEKVLDEPLPAGPLNLIAMGTLAANAPAWAPQYLGDGQYALTSTGSDGITRYLGADAADAFAGFLVAAGAVGRICEQDLRHVSVQQERFVLLTAGVSAHYAVAAEDPDVAALRYGLSRGGRLVIFFLLVVLLVRILLVILSGEGGNKGVIFLLRAAGQFERSAGELDAGK